jgi:hypothetical protein
VHAGGGLTALSRGSEGGPVMYQGP